MTHLRKNIQRRPTLAPSCGLRLTAVTVVCVLTAGCWEEIPYNPAISQSRKAARTAADTTQAEEPAQELPTAQPEPTQPEPPADDVVVLSEEMTETDSQPLIDVEAEDEVVAVESVEEAPVEEEPAEESPVADSGAAEPAPVVEMETAETEVVEEDLTPFDFGPEQPPMAGLTMPPVEVPAEEPAPLAVTSDPLEAAPEAGTDEADDHDAGDAEAHVTEQEPIEAEEEESDDPFADFVSSAQPQEKEKKVETSVAETGALDSSEEIDMLFGSSRPAPAETPPAPAAEMETPAESAEETTEEETTAEDVQPEEGSLTEAMPTEAPPTEAPLIEPVPAEPEIAAEPAITVEPAEELAIPAETPATETVPPPFETNPAEVKPAEVKRADVWRIASQWSMAMALYAKGVKPADYNQAWDAAATIAKGLDTALPELPGAQSPEPKQTSRRVQEIESSLLQKSGPSLWEAIGKQHGAKNEALAELAILTNRLLLVYTPQNVSAADLAAQLRGLGQAAELPSALWSPLVEKIGNGAPFAEVKREVFLMHKEITKQLEAE